MLPSSTDLIYFQEVATELHFSHAAKKLNVSQPSLSIAIKRLESLLGTTLLIRHNQGVNLTRSGEKLLQDVKKLLAQWEATVVNVKATAKSVQGIVTIGCHSTLTAHMGEMVAELYKHYPGLEIHFQHNITPKTMDNLIKGNCDIGIVIDSAPHPDVVMLPVANSEMGYWVAMEHQHKFDLFAEETIIICDPELSQTQYLIKELSKKTKHSQLKLNTMSSLETIVAMTIAGYGVGILPSNYTRKFYRDKLVPISGAPEYSRPMYIAYRHENRNVKAIQVVLEAMKELVKKENAAENCR